jgi:hypothetical protein
MDNSHIDSTFIDENLDWLSKNALKVHRFGGKTHLWYVTLPNGSTKTLNPSEYEYLLSKLNERLQEGR